MLLEGKGWMCQEYYNKYLDLKEEILYLTNRLYFLKQYPGSENTELNLDINSKLEQAVSDMRFVLEQLQLGGIKLEDLILLSLGVEV